MSVHRLTDRWLSGFKPPPRGRLEFADGLCPGLRARITSKGKKSFSVVHWVNGRQQRVTLGLYPHVSLAEAERAALFRPAYRQAQFAWAWLAWAGRLLPPEDHPEDVRSKPGNTDQLRHAFAALMLFAGQFGDGVVGPGKNLLKRLPRLDEQRTQVFVKAPEPSAA